MKTIKLLGLALAAILIGFTSCTKDEDLSSSNQAGEFCINATIPGYTFNSGTRVNISEDLQTFTWETGDLLGVYYSDSNVDAFSGFKIKQGGGSTGSFYNGSAFDLKKSTTYYAFYPFSSEATIGAAPVDYTGQVQTENGNTAHLSDYNYMYGKLTTDAGGQGSVNFNNLGAVMQIKISVPATDTYTSLSVKSNKKKFIIKGTANMTDGSISAVENCDSIFLSFGSGISMTGRDILTANILVAPVDLSGSELTFKLTGNTSNSSFTLNGKNMVKGKAYSYEGDCSIPVTGIRITGAEEEVWGYEYGWGVYADESLAGLSWEVLPANASNKNVTISSAPNDMVHAFLEQEMNEEEGGYRYIYSGNYSNGYVTPLKDGTALIMVTTEDGGFQDYVYIKSRRGIPPGPVHINVDNYVIPIGGNCNANYWVKYGERDHYAVFTSSDESILTSEGVGVSAGKATLTVTIYDSFANEETANDSVEITVVTQEEYNELIGE